MFGLRKQFRLGRFLSVNLAKRGRHRVRLATEVDSIDNAPDSPRLCSLLGRRNRSEGPVLSVLNRVFWQRPDGDAEVLLRLGRDGQDPWPPRPPPGGRG